MTALITAQQLAEATGANEISVAHWVPHLVAACERFHINTPARLAAFIAQIAHESGRFRYVKEIWGPTDAQKRYEGRRDLGNVREGDGKRFMGRGLIQITGRANYREIRLSLGIDVEANPQWLEQPQYAALSAAWFWYTKNLNALADRGDFDLITKRINGGQNGRDDRLALWASAKRAFGVV